MYHGKLYDVRRGYYKPNSNAAWWLELRTFDGRETLNVPMILVDVLERTYSGKQERGTN